MNVASSRNSQSRDDVINWYRILPVLAFPTGNEWNVNGAETKVFVPEKFLIIYGTILNVDHQQIRVSAILAYVTLPGRQGHSKSALLILSKETRNGTLLKTSSS